MRSVAKIYGGGRVWGFRVPLTEGWFSDAYILDMVALKYGIA